MANAVLIEVDGDAAGVLLAERGRFRFRAARRPFYALEGKLFGTPWQAERAAARLLAELPNQCACALRCAPSRPPTP